MLAEMRGTCGFVFAFLAACAAGCSDPATAPPGCVPPPAPTWGGMLTGSARNYMYLAPWMALAPGICLTLVVFSINMFGDALRDLLDPRMRNR